MKPVAQILLVEDNLLDVELAKAAFQRAGVKVALHHVVDGIEALAVLRDPKSPASRPDLILLDLNMPRMDGRALLGELKADDRLRSIPVVVFTSSHHDADVQAMYELQASCYLVKPTDFTDFLGLIKAFDEFWLQRVARPPRPPPQLDPSSGGTVSAPF